MRFRSSGIRFLLTTIILLFLTSVSLADGLDSPDTATASINPLWLQHEQHPVECGVFLYLETP